MPTAFEHLGRSAAITGAGLGGDIALGLSAKGYVVFRHAHVYHGSPIPEGSPGGRVSLMVCDTTKEQALKVLGQRRVGRNWQWRSDLLIGTGNLTLGRWRFCRLIRNEFEVRIPVP